MAERLETFFSGELVRRLAEDISRVDAGFPARAFVRSATRGLSDLALLGRAKHIAASLRRHLPADYPEAIGVLLRSLGPEHETDELLGVGMAPFFYLPHVLFVAEHGLGHFDLSMRAQHELTRRFSAEFSIRHYIAHDPERTFAVLRRWAADDSPHVRRLVSEGTRLRLPWGKRVPWLDRNPERILEFLELLRDDPANLVRRSVANNLNDMGKLHPKLTTETCGRWLELPTAERRTLVEHALRSLVKRGDPEALKLLGFGRKPSIALEDVRFSPKRVRIGNRVTVRFAVRSRSRSAQDLLVDLRVHFVKANRKTWPRVFKLARICLDGGGRAEFETRVSLAVHTTRKPQPGRHEAEVLANGTPIPLGAFEVVGTPVDSLRYSARP